MGAGKTTVSGFLDSNYYEMDDIIENRIGMSITEFFAKEGEEAFRDIESQVLRELMSKKEDIIISTGGGVVTREENRNLLRENKRNNILLSASFDVLYKRIQEDKVFQRPLYLNNSIENFRAIFEKRMTLYEDLADLVIGVDHRTPQEIARIILNS